MHFGLATLPVFGHMNPSVTLGAELLRRGHRVSLLSPRRGLPFAERAGLNWIPLHDYPDTDAVLARLAQLTGLAALRQTGVIMKAANEAICRELPILIQQHQLDALLIDQFSPASVVVAESEDLPYIVICNAIAVFDHPNAPNPVLGWPYRKNWLGQLQNQLGNECIRHLFEWFTWDHSPAWVNPLLLTKLDRQRGAAIVAQQPACFDFPSLPYPDHFHFTAPWHRPNRDQDIPFPWDRLDGRPLLYASMGTMQNRLRPIFSAILTAVKNLDVQLVLSLGRTDAKYTGKVPANALVVPFAPQLALLERASVVITHAGLNTTLEALANGLPMLCLPVANDQPGVAQRIAYHGAGLVLSADWARADRIRSRLIQLIRQPRFRHQAKRLQQQFLRLDGPSLAATIIERSLGYTSKTYSTTLSEMTSTSKCVT